MPKRVTWGGFDWTSWDGGNEEQMFASHGKSHRSAVTIEGEPYGKGGTTDGPLYLVVRNYIWSVAWEHRRRFRDWNRDYQESDVNLCAVGTQLVKQMCAPVGFASNISLACVGPLSIKVHEQNYNLFTNTLAGLLTNSETRLARFSNAVDDW